MNPSFEENFESPTLAKIQDVQAFEAAQAQEFPGLKLETGINW